MRDSLNTAAERPLEIVYFGADASWQSLQTIGFRRRNTCLLREFANHSHVRKLVVVTATTRGRACWQPFGWRLLRGFDRQEKVQDVFVFAFLPGQRWVPAIRRLNLRLARRSISRALARAGGSRVIQWCYWPDGYELARQIGLNGRIVFDADNDLLTCPTLRPERSRIETMLRDCAEQVEAVVCASPKFLARCAELGLKRPILLRNGVDVERFKSIAEEPEDLKRLARPRLGYVGTLSKWMDYELVLNLARTNPKWNFAFIGDPYLMEIPPALKAAPNVHFLGARKAEEVPAYLMRFDVGLVPYRQDAGSNADGDSMKIFEYLAARLPVVAADFNGRVAEDFENLITVASGATGFSRAIEGVLNQPEDSRQKWEVRRQAFLRRNTWTCRAEEAVTLMQAIVS